MQAFIPKNRRPKFTLTLTIHDLNNVPLVTGTSYVKWHIPSYSTSAEHRGHTSKQLIRDHKVAWSYSKQLDVRLAVDKNGVLSESEIQFEVLQEYSPSARAERIVLGNVRLNLAEYCVSGEEVEEEGVVEQEEGKGVVRRYLMRESKINSTLKIGIHMHTLDASIPYAAPPLKSAPVFGGIAGIMTSDAGGAGSYGDGGAGDSGWDSHMPSMSSKAQESGKLQDMYRQNLAASWAMQAGELPPDECIENIFAGGDGWADHGAQAPVAGVGEDSEEDRRTLRKARGHHQRGSSGSTLKPSLAPYKPHSSPKSASSSTLGSGMGVSGRASIEQQVHASADAKRAGHFRANEVDEFQEREDLRSWVIAAPS